jgi:hypothetical protein
MSSVVIQDEKFVECSYYQATTSTAVCKCFHQKPSSHSQDSEISRFVFYFFQVNNILFVAFLQFFLVFSF